MKTTRRGFMAVLAALGLAPKAAPLAAKEPEATVHLRDPHVPRNAPEFLGRILTWKDIEHLKVVSSRCELIDVTFWEQCDGYRHYLPGLITVTFIQTIDGKEYMCTAIGSPEHLTVMGMIAIA